MAVSYKRLFHLLIDRGITVAQLQQNAGYTQESYHVDECVYGGRNRCY